MYEVSFTINLPDDHESNWHVVTSDFNQAVDMVMTDHKDWTSLVITVTRTED